MSVHGRIHPSLAGSVQHKDGQTFVHLTHSQTSPRSWIPKLRGQKGLSTGVCPSPGITLCSCWSGKWAGKPSQAQLGGKARPSSPSSKGIWLIKWTVRLQRGWKQQIKPSPFSCCREGGDISPTTPPWQNPPVKLQLLSLSLRIHSQIPNIGHFSACLFGFFLLFFCN